MVKLSLHHLYEAYDRVQREKDLQDRGFKRRRTTIERYVSGGGSRAGSDGFQRMDTCRKALEAMDRRGWERSFHQVRWEGG